MKTQIHKRTLNRPSLKFERSILEIVAFFDSESAVIGVTGKDVDLIVNIQGPAPV